MILICIWIILYSSRVIIVVELILINIYGVLFIVVIIIVKLILIINELSLMNNVGINILFCLTIKQC